MVSKIDFMISHSKPASHNFLMIIFRLRFRNSMAPMEDTAFFRWAARYKFTLAMENYACDDYITEKLWRPLRLGSVPIVFGAPNIKVSTGPYCWFLCCTSSTIRSFINESRHEKKCHRVFLTRSDSNWPPQLQKLA